MSCSARSYHWPPQPAADSHHVIPQAWQHFATASTRLFDRRTVELCPNCHRRVHEAIVKLMRAGAGSDDPLRAKLAAYGNRALTREQQIAYDALTRFMGAPGRSLEALRAVRLWGEQ